MKLLVVLIFLVGIFPAWADVDAGSEAKITEHVGTKLDLSTAFRDEGNNEVRLADYFSGDKPVVLSLVYYDCPGLCNAYLNGFQTALKEVPMKVGHEFDTVTVSFDTSEQAELAQKKKQNYLADETDQAVKNGWHFLTGSDSSVKNITQAVGFGFKRDEATGEWLHGSAAIFIDSSGKVVRYLHGAFFDPQQVRLALVEASHGHVGNWSDLLRLQLSEFNHQRGKYELAMTKVLICFVLLTSVLVSIFVLIMKKLGWIKLESK